MSAILEFPRKVTQWTTAAELRTLLKANIGINARQASVKAGSSDRYLTITIRDASVNIAAVREFAAAFNTWSMDQSDLVTGQSVSMEVDPSVRKILAAPYLYAVQGLKFPEDRRGEEVIPGIMIWRDGWRVYFSSRKAGHQDRSRTFYANEIPCADTLVAMAYEIATLLA